MYIPPVGGSQYVRGSDSNNGVMQAVQNCIVQLQHVMSSSPPSEQMYEGMRQALLTLLGPNPEVQSRLPSPFAQFVLHGIIYQCDAYFHLNNPLYPTATSDPEIQQGICIGLMAAFAQVSNATSFPAVQSGDISDFNGCMQSLMQAINHGDSSGALAAVNSLKNLNLPTPYSAIVDEITSQYLSAFPPPSDHTTNYYVGMLTGLGNAFNYLTAPNYEQGVSYDGDFKEALKVYGDYEFAETDAQAETWAQPGSAAALFDLIYNPIHGMAMIPDGSGGGAPYTLSPQDWLENMQLFITGGNQLNPSDSTLMSNLALTLSAADQGMLTVFINGSPQGSPPPFERSVDQMLNSWGDGNVGSGAWYYQQYLNNGTFQNVATAAQHLMDAWLKSQGYL